MLTKGNPEAVASVVLIGIADRRFMSPMVRSRVLAGQPIQNDRTELLARYGEFHWSASITRSSGENETM